MFQAVGPPTRREILRLVWTKELAAGEIASRVDVSWPAVSQHLRVLRDSGFASVRIDGARRLYTVDAGPMKEVDAWIDQFRRFWERRLDALATEVARGKRKHQVRKVRTGASGA